MTGWPREWSRGFKEHVIAGGGKGFESVLRRLDEFQVGRLISAVGNTLHRVRRFIGVGVAEQHVDGVDGAQAGAADVGHVAQIEDEVARAVVESRGCPGCQRFIRYQIAFQLQDSDRGGPVFAPTRDVHVNCLLSSCL